MGCSKSSSISQGNSFLGSGLVAGLAGAPYYWHPYQIPGGKGKAKPCQLPAAKIIGLSNNRQRAPTTQIRTFLSALLAAIARVALPLQHQSGKRQRRFWLGKTVW
jgi:hypothetical protein